MRLLEHFQAAEKFHERGHTAHGSLEQAAPDRLVRLRMEHFLLLHMPGHPRSLEMFEFMEGDKAVAELFADAVKRRKEIECPISC